MKAGQVDFRRDKTGAGNVMELKNVSVSLLLTFGIPAIVAKEIARSGEQQLWANS
jgi:hypothetical protein